jgi:hypothetical protein
MTTSVPQNVLWAHWIVKDRIANPHHWVYSESNNRMNAIGQWPIKFPVTIDCSATATFLCWLSGFQDPNGLHYNHQGYTGTLLSHEQHIALFAKNAKGIQIEQVVPGDLVVYGPGTGTHVATIVEVHGRDILTVSMGQNGDPSYCWVNTPSANPHHYGVDGRKPQTFLQVNKKVIGKVHTPPAP